LEIPKDITTKSGETHMRQSSIITQIFLPIGARYLLLVRKSL